MYYNVLPTDNYDHQKYKKDKKRKLIKHMYITHTHTRFLYLQNYGERIVC